MLRRGKFSKHGLLKNDRKLFLKIAILVLFGHLYRKSVLTRSLYFIHPPPKKSKIKSMIVRLINSDKYCILQCLSSALRLKLISKLLDRKTIISDMKVFSELFIRQNSYNRSICTCYSCSALLAGREQQVWEYLCISVRARRLEPRRHGFHVGGRHFGGTRGHHRSDDQLQAGDLW